MHRSLGLLPLLVACGGADAGPDARTDHDARGPGPNLVTLSASGAQLVSYRDGQGAWQVPEAVDDGAYELHVTNDYQIVVACSDDTGFDAMLIASMFTDGGREFAFCGKGRPPRPTVEVTGQMVQAGTIWMDDLATSPTGPWDFALSVTPGPHDLFAVGSDRIVIRRDQDIAAATSVPVVDLVQDGSTLDAIPLSIAGVIAGDTVTTEVVVFATHDLAIIEGGADTALVPPDSLLEANDFLHLSIDATSATTVRSASTTLTGTPQTSYQLSPPLTGITYADDAGVLTASWDELPAHSELSMSLSSDASSMYVSVSAAWMSWTNATSLGFDVTPPGYDPAWSIDLDGPYVRRVGVYEYRGGVGYSTSAVESVNGAIAVPERRDPQRLATEHRIRR